jgi:sigma-E factor negative regulatory protein RseA
MTDTLKEQLSAFLDGELPEAETTLLLKRLERDDDLRGTLSRYSLIGAVLRTDGDVPAARHVAARVSAAIAREPSLDKAGRRPAGPPRWIRPAAGLAVAASVAMATIVLLPQWIGGDASTVVVASTVPDAGAGPTGSALLANTQIVPVAATVEEPAQSYTTPQASPEALVPLSSAQLASYLVAHSEYTSPLARSSIVTGTVTEQVPEAGQRPQGEGSN